jgi:hypothetical protein
VYENFSDQELLRMAQHETHPLLVAIAERLDMRIRDLEDYDAVYKPHHPQQLELDFGGNNHG